MTYFRRDLEKKLRIFDKFPVIAILGPRQSGKTTLARHVFKNHIFLNVEDLELRGLAQQDPKGFLRMYENEHGIIIDEFQNCPDLLSYIQVIVDAHDRPGYFILTGSQNFLMNQAISQSLAGRVGILNLLPLSINELEKNNLLEIHKAEEHIFKGGYPRLFKNFEPQEVYPSYIQTYIERDVRQIINAKNIATFQKFIKLCAARVGQLLNYTDLAVQCNISVPTVHNWLGILQTSYIVFLLQPYFNNFNKRVTKTPKLYFYDTGLVCSLLGIDSPQNLLLNSMYGSIFENFIITDLYKQYFNQGLPASLYFWRDKNGTLEIDCIIEQNMQLFPIEIKSGETFNNHYFDTIAKWSSIAEKSPEKAYVVYGGEQFFSGYKGNLVPWSQAGNLISRIKN